MTCVAVLVNGWSYLNVITEGTHWGTSLLATGIAFVLAIWAGKVQWQIERLEDGLEA